MIHIIESLTIEGWALIAAVLVVGFGLYELIDKAR